MADDSPASLVLRWFRGCLLVLGGMVALWAALQLLALIWGWLLLVAGIVLMLCAAVWAYRYWWGGRF